MTEHHIVTIHIDRVPRQSPAVTTGEALYVLGQVKPDWELFREETGETEDTLVPKTTAAYEVKKDQHFYSDPKVLNPGSGHGRGVR